MKVHDYAVYIITNKINTVFYIGVTSDLQGRIWEHKHKVYKGFLQNTNVTNWFILKSFSGYMMLLKGRNN